MNMTCNASSCSILVVLDEQATLYMRPAAMLTKIANQFESDVILEYEKERADGKSLIDIISLGISTGASFTVFSSGKDALYAIQAIRDFFTSFFIDGKITEAIAVVHGSSSDRTDINIEKKGE